MWEISKVKNMWEGIKGQVNRKKEKIDSLFPYIWMFGLKWKRDHRANFIDLCRRVKRKQEILMQL